MTKKQKNAGKARKAPKTAATPKPAKTANPAAPRERDPRLPAAGTTIKREYKGKEIRVQVLEDGFRCDGKEYRPLSALATEVCGNSANGFLWLRLTPRPARRPKQPKPAKIAKGKGEPAAPKDAAPETAPAAESATA